LPPVATVAVGDVPARDGDAAAPPTLKLPNEKATPTVDPTQGTTMRKVQMPEEKPQPIPASQDPGPAVGETPAKAPAPEPVGPPL
jgi:hypothetical protein